MGTRACYQLHIPAAKDVVSRVFLFSTQIFWKYLQPDLHRLQLCWRVVSTFFSFKETKWENAVRQSLAPRTE